jgi:hypothetical protein
VAGRAEAEAAAAAAKKKKKGTTRKTKVAAAKPPVVVFVVCQHATKQKQPRYRSLQLATGSAKISGEAIAAQPGISRGPAPLANAELWSTFPKLAAFVPACICRNVHSHAAASRASKVVCCLHPSQVSRHSMQAPGCPAQSYLS